MCVLCAVIYYIYKLKKKVLVLGLGLGFILYCKIWRSLALPYTYVLILAHVNKRRGRLFTGGVGLQWIQGMDLETRLSRDFVCIEFEPHLELMTNCPINIISSRAKRP